MMNVRLLKTSALALASIVSMSAISVGPAAATPTSVTFNFNNVGTVGNYTTNYANASSTRISSYMTSVLQTAGLTGKSVTVTGALGQQGSTSYTGDNHVVGPVISGKVYPLTLANTEGLTNPSTTGNWDTNPPTLSDSNVDGYLKNCTAIDPGLTNGGANGCSASSSDIFMNFGTLKIASFSFDFEIFPDGTCSAATSGSCGGALVKDSDGVWRYPNTPDLEIWTGDNKTGYNLTNFWGVSPGSNTTCDTTPSNSGDNATYTKSGAEAGTPVTETAPQVICHTTITNAMILAATGSSYLTTLDFMDWPETIGIDNLKIYLPEPTSIALFGFGILGLAMFARRKHLINRAV